MELSRYEYLKTLRYKNISTWDVKSFFHRIFESKYPIVSLGDYIKEENKKYDISIPNEKYGILGVDNKIGIFDAYMEDGKNINQKYKKMETGWIAYNPYRVNVGSIGIKKSEHKYDYISPAYVVFSCKPQLFNEYLFLLFKTSEFNKIIRKSTTGGVRQTLSYTILKTLQIPLPPVEEQKKMVEEYNNFVDIGNSQLNNSFGKTLEANSYLFKSIGVGEFHHNMNTISKEIFSFEIVSYKKIQEWNVDKILHSKVYESKKYDTKTFNGDKSLYEDIKRGKSPKYTSDSNAFVLNQKCIRWGYIESEYAKYVDNEWIQFIDKDCFTQEGDILINSTGEGTIGRAAIIDKTFEGLLYDSHILLLRLNKNKVLPKYFMYVFNSRYGQEQVENVKSAKTTKQTELGIDNLKKIQFPIPPINIQEEIVSTLDAMYVEIAELQLIDPYYKKALKTFATQIFE